MGNLSEVNNHLSLFFLPTVAFLGSVVVIFGAGVVDVEDDPAGAAIVDSTVPKIPLNQRSENPRPSAIASVVLSG